MKERNYGIDLFRVVLCLAVIALHSLDYFGIEDSFPYIIYILDAANGLFYIVSGYFNFEKEFNSNEDIKKYYKNRFITVLLPFMIYIFVWNIWDYIHVYDSINILEILRMFYEKLVDTSINGHMWFMYPLFGLLLSTPFLSKMLHNMDEKELKTLWYIAIGFNIIRYYLCLNIGLNFSISSWLLEGWIIYYIAGYYYHHVIVNESITKSIIIGVFSITFTLLGISEKLPFFKDFYGITDFQPMFVLYCVSIFAIWNKFVVIKEENISKIINFLSKNTYMIYLFHIRGIEYIVRKLAITENNIGNGLIVVFGTFLVSLLLGYIANLCLKPIQKLLGKVL